MGKDILHRVGNGGHCGCETVSREVLPQVEIPEKCSVAHCSRSQDIALFKFQLSYHSNPLQDTCPITSAVLGHLIRTRVPLMFLNWDKKSYQLCEKCATLKMDTGTSMFCHNNLVCD